MTWISATAGGDSTGRDTIFISAKMGISNRPDLSNASAHTPVASTKKVSVSATKADSTARDIPKIPVPKWQKHSMRVLILTLLKDYPGCRICGHRDLSPDLNGNGEIEPEEWIKACPCFNAEKDWGKV